jgi:hypothetical protein
MATNYRVMKCEPRHVFEVLANGWVYPSWVVGASRMRDVDEGWPQPGTRIYHSFGVWPMLVNDTTSVLEWDPPRHALLKARGWPIGEAHVAIDVRERGGISNVRMVEDAISGPARLIPGPARDAAIHTRNSETLRRLAYLAEGYAKNER